MEGRDRRVAPAWVGDFGMAPRGAARRSTRAAGSTPPTADSSPMNRWWTIIPLAVAATVPICATPSLAIAAIEAVAVLLSVLGIAVALTAPVTAGCVVAVIGYAVALRFGSAELDVIGGGIFGLALLFLLDLNEFTRRFRGAKIANDVLQAQLLYWLERAAIISGIVIVLALTGYMISSLVPASGRAIVSGLGVLLAFAGAIYGASIRAR